MTDYSNSPIGVSPLLTIEEAAQLLRIGRTQTYGLVMGGAIRSIKIGRRRLVLRAGLDEFIQRLVEEQDV
ncbi:MAG: helix-turn-helix domain-containing protein [Acidimicrobiales bacterium]